MMSTQAKKGLSFPAVTALSDSSAKMTFLVLSDTENGLLLDDLDRNIR